MKKNTKTILLAVLAAAFVPTAAVSVTALAANKESVVIDKVTDNGILAMDYVKTEGEDKSCYTPYETAGSLTLSTTTANTAQRHAKVGSSVAKDKIGENDYVEVSFDVFQLPAATWSWYNGFTTDVLGTKDDGNNTFMGWLKANGQSGISQLGAGAKLYDGAGAEKAAGGAWIAHGLTEAYLNNHITAYGNLSMKFEYYQNGTVKIYYGFIDRDGDETDRTTMKLSQYVENAYVYNGTADEYWFSMAIGNAGNEKIEVDNWTVKVINSQDATDVETITSTDFSDLDKIVEDPTAADEVAADNYYKVTYLDVLNPAADNRLESLSKIKYDEDASVCFEMSASLSLFELPAGKKVGFAYGLSARDSALDTGTFVYFYNEDDVTYINSSVAGVEGTPVSLGANMVSADVNYIDVSITCNNALEMEVTVGDITYTLTANTVDGYMAITQTGEGNCHYAIGTELSLINYTYRAGDGESLEHPFNVDYLDFDAYTVQSTNAPHYADPNEAEGIVVEDGALKFKGTSINAHFATAKTYADFILEFDYTTVAFADRPELNETGETFGYSALGIAFGKPEAVGGWTTGKLIMLRDIYSKNDSFAPSYVQFYKDNGAQNVTTQTLATRVEAEATAEGAITDSEGQSFTLQTVEGMPTVYNATTRLKLVVLNNHATLYGVNIVDGEPVGDYVVMIEGDVKDSYGYVSLSTDANAYFSIDNFRITNYDAETLAGKTAAEILEEYEDHKTLADVVAPTKLPAPVITLTDNVVSWTAVENATSYIVSVNGTPLEAQTETSYTIAETAEGSYEISVVAISDGSKIWLDSLASNKVTYTIGGGSTDNENSGNTGNSGNTDNSAPATDSSTSDGGFLSGCFGSIHAGVFGILTLAASAVAIKRKRK